MAMGNIIHKSVPVQVWVDVDIGILEVVERLNKMLGVRTCSSCQGTLGEGGAEPYPAFVEVSWEDDAALERIRAAYPITIAGVNFGTVYPDTKWRGRP
jgi:hypothetical protein